MREYGIPQWERSFTEILEGELKYWSLEEALQIIREEVDHQGGVRVFSERWGWNSSALHDVVIHGKRPPRALLACLGYLNVVIGSSPAEEYEKYLASLSQQEWDAMYLGEFPPLDEGDRADARS